VQVRLTLSGKTDAYSQHEGPSLNASYLPKPFRRLMQELRAAQE